MSRVTTHVLDLARVEPARGMKVALQRINEGGLAITIGIQETDADGRARELLAPSTRLEPGRYRLVFESGAYHRAQGASGFFPQVAIDFDIRDADAHHHVPLLLSPFGYSTYRGS